MSVSEALDWLGRSETAPRVKITALPASYFKFPPSSEPTTLPPPADHPTLAHPFTIPTDVYNALLSPNVPITIALVYMSVVSLLNNVNANRKYKPWAFSRTRLFKLLVVLHNVVLAVYSGWTFVGMLNALRLSLPELNDQWSLTGTVDALCKIHGPRGVGNAATYNATTTAWTMTNRVFHLAADGLGPESTDVGRIWNEGLAFYGWLFYLSKFYEVLDTCIILAKGKKSSLLQTYHHAGAMLSMWAGIRYMSPPIWMFVFVNSGIHAIMVSRRTEAWHHIAKSIIVHLLSLLCTPHSCAKVSQADLDDPPDHSIRRGSRLCVFPPFHRISDSSQCSVPVPSWDCGFEGCV